MMNISYETLDAATRAETAFNSWEDFVRTCKMGYVPTIYPDTSARRILRAALRAEGCAVWPRDPSRGGLANAPLAALPL